MFQSTPRSQPAVSVHKFLGSPSSESPALRECHHLKSPREAERKGWGQTTPAAVLLEGVKEDPWYLQPDQEAELKEATFSLVRSDGTSGLPSKTF